MIRHIIWDAGGTLFDTYPAMTTALGRTLAQMDHEVSGDVITALLRISRKHAFDALSTRFKLNRTELEAVYRSKYKHIDVNQQVPFPGVLDVCKLIEQRGGHNFIITHRSWNGLRSLLDAHQMNAIFQDCITSDAGYPRKPDPTSILALMAKHALATGEVVLVGDRAIDIQAGQDAGISTCLFCPSTCDEQADLVVSHYAELLDYLQTEVYT